jgi:hypothetical protein
MSSSRKTYDTEIITLRQINALNSNNSFIEAGKALVSIGNGKTTWEYVSSIGLPAFNTIVGNGTSILANSSTNTFTLSTLDGMGMITDSGAKSISLFGKGITQIDVSGNNSLKSYSNSLLTPTIKLAGVGGVSLSSDPQTNTLFITSSQPTISTGIYGYHSVNVYSNVLTSNTSAFADPNKAVLTSTSPSTHLTVLGLGEIQLFANITSNAYFIGISSFTSQTYLGMSTTIAQNASTVSSSILSLPSSLAALSTPIYNSISNLSVSVATRIDYDANYFLTNYVPLNIYQTNSTNTASVLANLTTPFVSSLSVSEGGTSQAAILASDVLYVSSTRFSLLSLSNLIYSTDGPANFTFTPSLVFGTNTVGTSNTIFGISTLLYAGQTPLLESAVNRPWMATNTVGSNLYTDSLSVQLSRTTMINNVTSSIILMHQITPFTVGGTGGIVSQTVENRISPLNSVFIRMF